MESCPSFDPLGPYVTGLLASIDCQALNFAEAGYRTMGSGAAVGGIIGGLITILIAVTGYRLLLGDTIGLREGVGVTMRIGIVMALAFQWAAFQPVVYDLVMRAPDRMASLLMGRSEDDTQMRGMLAGRVQGVYGAMDALARPDPQAAQPGAGVGSAFDLGATTIQATLSPDDRKMIESAASQLLVTSLGGLIGLRLVSAMLLALAPLFIAGLLFEATRGLLSGWLRTLAGAAIASVYVPIMMAFVLQILEPQLAALSRIVEAGETVRMLPGEIVATTSLFAVLLAAGIALLVWACAALRLPEPFRLHVTARPEPAPQPSGSFAVDRQAGPSGTDLHPSRAQMTGQMLSLIERRDADNAIRTPSTGANGQMGRARDEAASQAVVTIPLGQSGRRLASRSSQAATRREGMNR